MAVKTVFGLLLAFLPIVAGAQAQDRSQRTVQADDRVVREVVRMLDAGVDDEVILLWLEREGRRPAAVSPDDLIALTRSEASRELIDALMEASEPAEPDVELRSLPQGNAVRLELSIAYRPYRDPEADEEEQWHLFVYLDGRPLAWSDGKNWLSESKSNREVSVLVSARTHVLRLVQERHRRRGSGWVHEARVCPAAIEFDASEGLAQIGIEIKQATGLGFGKPIYRWVRWDHYVAEETALPGPPESWTPLCEEIESNYPDAAKIPRRVRKQLDRCTRWTDLWPAEIDAPDRGTVRSRLERYEFRPILGPN